MTNSNIIPNVTIIDAVADLFKKESGLDVKLEHIESNVLEADITKQGLFRYMFDRVNVKCKVFQNKNDINEVDFIFYFCWYVQNHFNSVDVAQITFKDNDYSFTWIEPQSKKFIYASS